jgi:hypothetical protein
MCKAVNRALSCMLLQNSGLQKGATLQACARWSRKHGARYLCCMRVRGHISRSSRIEHSMLVAEQSHADEILQVARPVAVTHSKGAPAPPASSLEASICWSTAASAFQSDAQVISRCRSSQPLLQAATLDAMLTARNTSSASPQAAAAARTRSTSCKWEHA